ncbi:MAG: PTS sugar transporter subunit IIA [Angelakisella sp.]
MLRELVEQGHTLFVDSVPDWREALRLGCATLVADGTVTEAYADELIASVEKHGPYIVLMPGFAMPHSMEGSACAHGTAIAFMKVNTPVQFDPDDRDKDATVFFTLASVDTDAHLKNMQQLFKMLTNEELVAQLPLVTCNEDLLRLSEKYLDNK